MVDYNTMTILILLTDKKRITDYKYIDGNWNGYTILYYYFK